MAANTSPIFTRTPDVQWIGAVATANTTTDLTTGTVYLAFTADATEGGFIQKLIFRPLGTNTASVARVWLNNGSDPTGAAANNTCIAEATLAATTVSQVAQLTSVEVLIDFAIPAGYRLYVTLGTTVASGYNVSTIAGRY